MLLAVLLVVGSSPWVGKSRQRVVLTAIMAILYCPVVFVLLLQWRAMYIFAPARVAFALTAIRLARRAELPYPTPEGLQNRFAVRYPNSCFFSKHILPGVGPNGVRPAPAPSALIFLIFPPRFATPAFRL
jgi:hypothetical protein